jgi:hypothetical protein
LLDVDWDAPVVLLVRRTLTYVLLTVIASVIFDKPFPALAVELGAMVLFGALLLALPVGPGHEDDASEGQDKGPVAAPAGAGATRQVAGRSEPLSQRPPLPL